MLQASRSVSLNALRVFAIAAEYRSIKQAAAELGLTPGAVSHQVRALEDGLGVRLFARSNNSIELTDAGALLFERGLAGLRVIDDAVAAVTREASELCVQAPLTLAVRWLIPRLEEFRERHPTARVSVETYGAPEPPPGGDADIQIAYHPAVTEPPDEDLLLRDDCRPYLSPDLLSRLGEAATLSEVPALQCTLANWDWKMWLDLSGQGQAKLKYAERFDVDDAGLRAAVAGMGMVLAPHFMIADDVAAGRLSPFPGAPEIALGFYTVRHGRRDTGLSLSFVRWLRSLEGAT
ncbi:MAG: LysR family transcriptional regulator [Pseudomonadota bacterium]